MPLIVRNVSLRWNEPEELLRRRVAGVLGISQGTIRTLAVVRKAIDARRRDDVRMIYSVEAAIDGDEEPILRRCRPNVVGRLVVEPPAEIAPGGEALDERVAIIGSGPAGLFAGIYLADMGYRPLILERGQDAPLRHRARHQFYTTGKFDPENNLLFGIGGAGTYSDGKLYSRTHDPRNAWVLQQLVRFGADPNILIDAKPHVGSDRLPGICRKMVKHIIAKGGEVRFGAKVVDIELADDAQQSPGGATRRIDALRLESGERIAARVCILAIGYSARDTYRMLAKRGVRLAAKPFQMGVRIEHPQEMINRNQFGTAADGLPPADYHMVAKSVLRDSPAGADMWSFCMCPGGIILPSNESAGEICTNGASNAKRNSPFANSGLVVTIDPSEFNNDALAGVEYQRRWERAAYELSGSYAVPSQRASDFLARRRSDGSLETSYPLGAVSADIREILPRQCIESLERGLPMLNRMIAGYASSDGIITGPETRASSPVRIERQHETRESLSVAGIYPVGEGAGFSGGIVSSATDGLKSAEMIVGKYAVYRLR